MNNRKKLLIIGLRIVILLMIIFGITHITLSVIKIYNTDYNLLPLLVINFQIIVEIIIFVQSPLILNTAVQALYEEEKTLDAVTPESYPELDVFVPIRFVKVETLKQTLEHLTTQDYPKDKLTIFVCDDTPDEEKSETYKSLCNEMGVQYVYDPTNVKYKSGMLNIALPHGDAEYIAFFDHDQIPLEGILKRMVEVLLAYPDKPFVQAKKRFRNLYNLSRVWSALLYVIFFEIMLLTKRKLGTVVFAGSTACFRREHIEDVGGIPEDTFTEDNELATKMLIHGKHGLFLNEYGSVGTVPTGFRAQISQLWRWSHGGANVFHNEWKNVLKSDKITLNQKIDALSLLLITPSLVAYYVYIFSFTPLLANGIDSVRVTYFGISSLLFMPIIPGTTYLILSGLAIKKAEENGMEFNLKQLPGFLIIGLSANLMILSSGVYGILGKLSPNSKRGRWTRHIRIVTNSTFATLIGILLTYYSIQWLLSGLTAAIGVLIIAITLVPTLPVVLYYDISDVKSKMKNTH